MTLRILTTCQGRAAFNQKGSVGHVSEGARPLLVSDLKHLAPPWPGRWRLPCQHPGQLLALGFAQVSAQIVADGGG